MVVDFPFGMRIYQDSGKQKLPPGNISFITSHIFFRKLNSVEDFFLSHWCKIIISIYEMQFCFLKKNPWFWLAFVGSWLVSRNCVLSRKYEIRSHIWKKKKPFLDINQWKLMNFISSCLQSNDYLVMRSCNH